jgi:hypothetical protein
MAPEAPRELLADDSSVVESEIEPAKAARREPPGLDGVVPCARSSPDRRGLVNDAHGVPAWIALRVGIDAED